MAPGGIRSPRQVSTPWRGRLIAWWRVPCHSCNRIRLTADGKLRNCLFALSELDARAVLRGAEDPAAQEAGLAALIRRSVGDKWEGHEINRATFQAPARPMHAIGG
jgi:cyclic pyranopterin phosphate synthase